MSIVGIIGAGRLGVRLTEELVRQKICDHVMLWNRSAPKLRGVLQSLRVWRSINRLEPLISELDWKCLSEIDLMVIAVKENYDPRLLMAVDRPQWLPRDLRYIGLPYDIPSLYRLSRDLLSGYSGTVLVLTNPVDLVSSLLQQWLPNCLILGSGLSVDIARFEYFLRERIPSLREIRVAMLGEHGPHAFISSISTIPEVDIAQDVVNQSLYSAFRIGYDIVNDLGYTLQDCATAMAEDISWIVRKAHSTRSLSRWRFRACVGMPLTWSSSGRLSPVSNIDMNSQMDAIEASIGALADHCREAWPALF